MNDVRDVLAQSDMVFITVLKFNLTRLQIPWVLTTLHKEIHNDDLENAMV